MSDSAVTSFRAASKKRADDPERHYLIYCDESGVHGTRLTGFGSLWMTYERRGDFQQLWRDLHGRYFAPSEVKWEKVKKETQPFFTALVDEFFKRKWLMFHCLLIDKQDVDLSCHGNDWDLARRKHFTLFLANKILRFATPSKHYLIRVDPIHSRYAKADEAAQTILSHIVDRSPRLRGSQTIESLMTVDSKDTPGVQLADLFVGAVLAARHGEITSGPKHAVIRRIATHLGWKDLTSDTLPSARKFNIWRFWDPTSGKPRPEMTRLTTKTP
jgi:hypothetical protein